MFLKLKIKLFKHPKFGKVEVAVLDRMGDNRLVAQLSPDHHFELAPGGGPYTYWIDKRRLS